MSDLRQSYFKIIEDDFPEELTISLGGQSLVFRKRTWAMGQTRQGLRYGENPGQQAALFELVSGNLTLAGTEYIQPGRGLVSALKEEDFLQFGKHPGKINLTDVDTALTVLRELPDKPCAVIVKHNNPCGVARAETIVQAYLKADQADRIAAFGGAAVFNRPVDKDLAQALAWRYLEVVAAPDYEEGVLEILNRAKNLRIMRLSRLDELVKWRDARFLDFKSLIDGGLIVQQSALNTVRRPEDLQPARAEGQGRVYEVKRPPSPEEVEDMLFGWAVEQGVTSNSVIFVKDGATVGIGTGEQDRVGVAEIAVFKAYTKYADALCFSRFGLPYKQLEAETASGQRPAADKEDLDRATAEAQGGLAGATMVSDAFFPFRDGVEVGLRQGVRAVVQPGGSLRDWEVIEAVNEFGATMAFTGQRAFRH
ncbi:MAG: IMP cyclohydrolase [Deltaproteobacteria bacterium]|nr:IMP cyclohydrolase [Deltaproteobacteria bacterium]